MSTFWLIAIVVAFINALVNAHEDSVNLEASKKVLQLAAEFESRKGKGT